MFKRKSKARREFEELAVPHIDGLYGTAFRLTRNAGDAEDLVQETMLRAYRFWDSFRKDSNCRAWLFRILSNTFINSYQSRKRRREIVHQAGTEQSTRDGVLFQRDSLAHADPHAAMVHNTMSKDVTDALDNLPDDFRLAVILSDLMGFSYKEIAEIMECPVGTVMSRLYRGRKLLQASLLEFAAEQGIPSAIVSLERYRAEVAQATEAAEQE